VTAQRSVASRVAGAAVGVATLAGVVAVATVLWLLGGYRPAAPGGDPTLLPAGVSASQGWARWHAISVAVAAVASLVATGAALAERSWWRAAAATVAMAGLLVVLATIPLLRWDQLALWAVTIGTDIAGYGVAAFDDRVRFVLVDDQEVTPAQYAVALVAHLAGHAVAVAGIAAGAVLQLRGRRSSSSSR
jgi:hypothetical protein